MASYSNEIGEVSGLNEGHEKSLPKDFVTFGNWAFPGQWKTLSIQQQPSVLAL